MKQKTIDDLKQVFAKAAQEVYDMWSQDDDGLDEDIGFGGICDRIVDAAMLDFTMLGYDVEDDSEAGEHASLILTEENGTRLRFDIPCHLYEEGSGYNYTKIPNVVLSAEDVEVTKLEE